MNSILLEVVVVVMRHLDLNFIMFVYMPII